MVNDYAYIFVFLIYVYFFLDFQKSFVFGIQLTVCDDLFHIRPKISLPPINILENNTMHMLMKTANQSILNRNTGHFYFLPITVDKERIKFATEQFCSLTRTGFPRSSIIYISFDKESCISLRKMKATCEVVNIHQIPFFNASRGKFHMKIYLLYLQNWWGFDAFTLDSDVIFFDHIENAFFNNNVDIEMSSDDNIRVSQNDAAKSKRHNSGFGRFLPTEASNKIINEIWARSLNLGEYRDQIIHMLVYNNWRGTRAKNDNGTEIWKKDNLKAKFRIIDPLKVANGGISMCRGRNEYWKQINQYSHVKYKMPVALHFNWDVYNKVLTYKWLGLKMCKIYNKNNAKKLKKRILLTNCVTVWGCSKCYVNTTKKFLRSKIFF